MKLYMKYCSPYILKSIIGNISLSFILTCMRAVPGVLQDVFWAATSCSAAFPVWRLYFMRRCFLLCRHSDGIHPCGGGARGFDGFGSIVRRRGVVTGEFLVAKRMKADSCQVFMEAGIEFSPDRPHLCRPSVMLPSGVSVSHNQIEPFNSLPVILMLAGGNRMYFSGPLLLIYASYACMLSPTLEGL